MIEKQDHGFIFVKKRIRIIGCSQQAKEEKTAVCAAGEVYGSAGATAATPTITRRNGVNTAVSNNSISNTYEKTNRKKNFYRGRYAGAGRGI